jgi:hypothetical protein
MFRYEIVAVALVYSMKKIQSRNGQSPIINGKQTFEIVVLCLHSLEPYKTRKPP